MVAPRCSTGPRLVRCASREYVPAMRHRLARAPFAFLLAAAAGCGAPPAPVTPAAPPPAADLPAATTPVSAPAATTVGPLAPQDASLGQLDFVVTGSGECQRKFREGMLALHSFLYDQAHEAFAAAAAADPRCTMAAWGDAMAYDHPVWDERDVAKGRAALARARAGKRGRPGSGMTGRLAFRLVSHGGFQGVGGLQVVRGGGRGRWFARARGSARFSARANLVGH